MKTAQGVTNLRVSFATVAALLALATAGFATARTLSTPGREDNGRLCSETCGALSTTPALSPVVHGVRDSHAVTDSGSNQRRRLP